MVSEQSPIQEGLTTLEKRFASTKMEFDHSFAFQAGASLTQPPLFDCSNYPIWKILMMVFIKAHDIELWKVIVLGPHIIKNQDGSLKSEQEYTNADWNNERINAQAMQFLLCNLTNQEIQRVLNCRSA